MKLQNQQQGQAILEYILLVVMIAITMAITIRNSNFFIYQFWTGLAGVVSKPCPDCTSDPYPMNP